LQGKSLRVTAPLLWLEFYLSEMKDWIYACGSAGNALVERLYIEFAAENLLPRNDD